MPLALSLQTVFYAISVNTVHSPPGGSFSLSDVPRSAIVLAACWPVGLILLNEAVKHNYHQHFVKEQKRAKITFGTKLGMHSPV